MSDINTATMTRSELEQAASDLGINFQSNTKDDTLRKKINDALGAPSTADDEEGGGLPEPQAVKKERRFEVIIATHERDKQPVQVGINGRMYVIKRGEKVTVPESVVKALETASRDVYDPETMEKSQVLSYPFTAREVG